MLAEPGWDRGETTATMPGGGSGGLSRHAGARLRRRRRSDRPLLGILALAVGVVWLLEVTVIRINGETVLSLLLMLLGLGLVATGRRGGRMWPLLLGLGLTVALVAGSTSFHLEIPTSGGFGNRLYTPASASELQPRYELTAGNLTLDLRQLQGPVTQPVVIREGFGKVTIVVGKNTPVDVQARVSFGSFASPNDSQPRGGVGVREDYTQGTSSPVRIDVKDFAGSVAVTRSDPSPPATPTGPTPPAPPQ